MVNTRRQNEKADANPSKPVFSKAQNDLLIQKMHEYSLQPAVAWIVHGRQLKRQSQGNGFHP